MNRIITPLLIAVIIAAGFVVSTPYSWIAWTLAGAATIIWGTSEVIRWRAR